jgi:ferric-dicitrate binding protein FerR (iron transport regulator)
MQFPDRDRFGTEDLERGMRRGHARQLAVIAGIAVLMLLVFNSGGLARWTQSLPSTPGNVQIAEWAQDWHALMTRLGPAAFFERLRPAKDGS